MTLREHSGGLGVSEVAIVWPVLSATTETLELAVPGSGFHSVPGQQHEPQLGIC